MNHKIDRIEYITQKDIMADYGFTKGMINNLLPPPILKDNPFYKNAAKIKLWDKQVVIRIMQSSEYKKVYEKVARRRETIRKTAAMKTEKKMGEIRTHTAECTVERISPQKVREIAVNMMQQKYEKRKEYDPFFNGTIEEADEATISRWCVNYILQNHTYYDGILYTSFRKNVTQKQDFFLKEDALKMISLVYPEYYEECSNQIEVNRTNKAYHDMLTET